MTVPVRMGTTTDRTVAPVIAAMIGRGVDLRPELAASVTGRARLRFAEGWPPVVIDFNGDIHVYDDRGTDVDTEIHAALPDLVAVLAAPLSGGVPKPTTREGRAAIARLARGHVDVDGSWALAWKLLRLLSVYESDADA